MTDVARLREERDVLKKFALSVAELDLNAEQRRRVTLSDLIDKANAALTDRPSATECNTNYSVTDVPILLASMHLLSEEMMNLRATMAVATTRHARMRQALQLLDSWMSAIPGTPGLRVVAQHDVARILDVDCANAEVSIESTDR